MDKCYNNGGWTMTAVILAAGYSSRMGGFKPLLSIGGMSALEIQLRMLRSAGVGDIVVVTGHARERLAGQIAEAGAREAFNSDFAKGMFASVQAGIRKMPAGSACLLMPADCPLISAGTVKALLAAHEKHPASFIVACYRGKKGHPLLIPAQYTQEILAHDGEGGLKAVTNRHEEYLIRLETDDEGAVLDMDTPENYAELLAYAEARRQDPKKFTGRLFLVRHGEIRKHAEKIFLGQTDAPLSEEGRRQAAEAAETLVRRHGVHVDAVYSSDLKRAAETAEIIAARLCAEDGAAVCVKTDARLREMHLGDWDGRFIREIKERHPEEYARRGAEPLTWKSGHDGENYYDLRYRAVKSLKAMFDVSAEPAGRDVLIVSHAGTIKTILAEFSGADPRTAWEMKIPRGAVLHLDITAYEAEGADHEGDSGSGRGGNGFGA
ncbi:MAG: histidine phosphatase family protein [Clostridiales Family XIII bacterium]|nr:histidine phosphatase family protein [Clostridiales Family XIII bacterium]